MTNARMEIAARGQRGAAALDRRSRGRRHLVIDARGSSRRSTLAPSGCSATHSDDVRERTSTC
jgi:hypothetical protein